MVAASLMIAVLVLYIALLFVCAVVGERYMNRLSSRLRIVLFSLTLGVYCSSWTYYGATGAAVREGILFLPIYLGPLLFMWLGFDSWQRLGRIRQFHSVTSIADFIAARYGKSGTLAAMITLLAVLAIVPYLALQLRAIAQSSNLILLHSHAPTLASNGILMLTACLSLLAIGFATRQMTPTEQHNGLMLAVAVESFVKLFALLAVALFFILHSPHSLRQISQDLSHTVQQVQQHGLPPTFWVQTMLAGLAMICLPRQFHVAVVELRDVGYLRAARRWFSLYLILFVLAIFPLASWALHSQGVWQSADVAVLMLPLHYDEVGLTMLAFLGGFSASTGMLLVSSVALSIMLSNDVIMPLLWRLNWINHQDARLPIILKWVRGCAIVMVMGLGFGFYQLFADATQLSMFGLLAFSAVAQFAPALLGGLYWRRGSRYGVMSGLAVGFVLWGYTLLLPNLLRSLSPMGFGQTLLQHGLFGLHGLRPEALLGFVPQSALTHGVMWSLGANVLCYMWVSRRSPPSVREQLQAERFFIAPNQPQQPILTVADKAPSRFQVADLLALCGRVVGDSASQQAFKHFAAEQQWQLDYTKTADSRWWRFCEQFLASAIGTASARTLLSSALADDGLTTAQIANLLDHSTQWQRFNQNLILTMMDHITQGVSVVDAELRLVAWNQQYLQLFDYPKELIYVGCPIAELIRYNALRGDCGVGSVEQHIQKRLNYMRQGSSYQFERYRADGRVLQIQGNPISGGGFVTTYADITVFRQQESVLEARVKQRTIELETALVLQQEARRQADLANHSKSRFLAAASHDLLQPMHAARLFSAALAHGGEQVQVTAHQRDTLAQLDRALHGAETMLSALLDIARLEGGNLKPNLQPLGLQELFDDLQAQFGSIAEQRGLALRIHPTRHWLLTDAQWIRRIVQNLLSNALRYTAHGRIIVGVLSSSHEGHIRLGVWDSGMGIDEAQQQRLFGEFARGGHLSPWGEQGLGLGLAIVQRMVQQLDYRITVDSEVGRGSCFMIEMPYIAPPTLTQPSSSAPVLQGMQRSLTILCVDNDATILQAMQTLLSKWGYHTVLANSTQQALMLLQQQAVDVWLIDQHLDADLGLDFIVRHRPSDVPCALLTADSDPDLPIKLKEIGVLLLKKPIKPAALRAFLQSVSG